MSRSWRWTVPLLLGLLAAAPGQGQDELLLTASATPTYRLGFEVKAHVRDSDSMRFPNPFPFGPDMLPPGQMQGFLETVDAGSHAEISVVTLFAEAQWSPLLGGKLKIDLIDLYDRNPTSDDRKWDVDEVWFRLGRETEPGFLPDGRGAYVKLGKFPKFERQDDRHLESYGVVTTAFNRMEDVGVEIGIDLGRHLYLKGSYTHGNPVFIRDPNALAGDNGIELLRTPNPNPPKKSGLPILYDLDVDIDDADFANPETGGGLGARFGNASGGFNVDVLAWGYERRLADALELRGTFYGGDLDLLNGPFDTFSLPITNDEKRELGATVWIYAGDFTFYGQYVDQDLAGLDRSGYEGEVSWSFNLPLVWAAGGRQLFAWIAPAVRYSKLDPEFAANRDPRLPFPAPSVSWEWEKLDVGVRLGIWEQLDLTLEWQANDFIRQGREESNDEFLATFRWAFERGLG